MRWSKLFAPTLRENPGDAEAASHRLLLRGGFIRQLHAGHYSLLPLGLKVHDKVAAIVRDEMNRIDGQEFLLPAMHPAAVWQQSGRWETMGQEMFRLVDRRGNELALGMTHEEIFTLVATEVNSYKQLPQIWYQIQTKFRDEPRPKAGLLRVREFAMKDAYSFHLDEAGLDETFDAHHDAYLRMFERLGLPAFPVEASSGAMGGGQSLEFMVPSPAGEDDVARCTSCGYAANVERATSALRAVDTAAGPDELERFPTPGIVTIAALAEFEGGAAAEHQLKTLVMVLDGVVTLVVVRGDHQLNLQKLQDATAAIDIRPAEAEETVAALGAKPGSLGAVGVTHLKVIADESVRSRVHMTTGANEDGWHLRGVDVDRDLDVALWADLREIGAGEPCPRCEAPLEVVKCIEAGHIFKLGTKYSEAMGATVLDAEGVTRPMIMGCYGIGIGRALAAVVESHHDDRGMIWPVSIAPFEVAITIVKMNDQESVDVADKLYGDLMAAGVDVIIDDRDERPGVKFADSELIGIPYRITIGPKGLADGNVEFTARTDGERRDVSLGEIVDHVLDLVGSGN